MTKPYIVTFSGVPGVSKSIVAHHLSERMGLPIFSTDNIRFEVREDLLSDRFRVPEVMAEYESRRAERLSWLFDRQQSFIMDGSVDRTWPDLKGRVQAAKYAWFLIGMEFSETFITNLYNKTGRNRAIGELPTYMQQHESFMAQHANDINMYITDETFPRRKAVAEAALKSFLDDKSSHLK